MDTKIVRLYCDTIIKPIEKRKKELEKEIYCHRFVSHSKKEELRLINELLIEKFINLSKLTDKYDI